MALAWGQAGPPQWQAGSMTCYQRHLGGLFEGLDLPYERDERRRVHAAIIDVLDLAEDAPCPEVWSALKAAYQPIEQNLPALVRDVAGALPAR